MRWSCIALAAALAALAAPAAAQTTNPPAKPPSKPAPKATSKLPQSLKDLMLEATPQERETIENVAKRLYPNARPEIDKVVDKVEAEHKAEVGKQKFVEGWTGNVSLGASKSTGNTNEWNLSGSVDIKREGPRWEHNFDLNAVIGDTNGQRTEERITGSYRARRDFGKSPLFLFGSLGYERDKFQGIDRRFIEAVGVGYQIFDTDHFDWEVSAGPALRQTKFTNATSESLFAAMAGTKLEWEINDTLTFTQKVGAVLDTDTSSFTSTTALTSKIYGRLSGKLSFDIDLETNPPAGNEQLDTYSRISLTYAF